MTYLGDFKASSTVNFPFVTNAGTGAPIAPLSAFEAADLSIYKDNSATKRSSSAGVTMTSPFNSIVGLHQVSIDTSDNTDAGFYAAGHDYFCILNPDTETVDSQTVLTIVAVFSIENRVVNWAKVAGPTTTVGLTGTTISTSQVVASVAGAVGSVTTVSDKTGYALSAGGVQAIWDALTSALTTVNSIGKRLVDFVTTLVYAAPPSAAPTAVQVRQEMDSNSTKLAAIVAALPDVGISSTIDDVSPSTTAFTGDSALSAANDFYKDCALVFLGGDLQGVAGWIDDYVGSTRQFVFNTAFPAAPENGDAFIILGKRENA